MMRWMALTCQGHSMLCCGPYITNVIYRKTRASLHLTVVGSNTRFPSALIRHANLSSNCGVGEAPLPGSALALFSRV